jgi:hypothetical protein
MRPSLALLFATARVPVTVQAVLVAKPIRRRRTIAPLAALALVGVLAQPAAAVHIGAIVDCADAGTFTIRATPNGAGFEAPILGGVLLFEEGGTLIPLEVYRNGVLQWNNAAPGMAVNAVEEITCTFTIASGYWEVTGAYTGR